MLAESIEYTTNDTVLLYPTDTIYWLGGLITPQVVEKIIRIKQRPSDKPLSIIAPSIQWIKNNFLVKDVFFDERSNRKQQFPWRWLTLLLPLRTDRDGEVDFSLISPSTLIGVRLINHPFQAIVEKLWKPFITTSANLSWQPNITHPSQLTDEQLQLIDYVIDEGTIDAPASVIIDYSTKEIIRS